VLTDAGELLYDYAKRILSLRDQTFNVVAELKALRRGRVRIGANESTSLYLLPHLILEYRALHPDVMVEIFRQSSERLPREVLDRNVDFAVMAFEPVDNDLESFPVCGMSWCSSHTRNTIWRKCDPSQLKNWETSPSWRITLKPARATK